MCSIRSPAIDNRGLWSAKLHLGEATRSWLLNANAPATEATLANPFKNPAHPVHRTRRIKVSLAIFHPPEFHLIGLQPRYEESGIARLWDYRRRWPFCREVKISCRVNDVGCMKQDERIEVALFHFLPHLTNLPLVPSLRQTIAGPWMRERGRKVHSACPCETARVGGDTQCGRSGRCAHKNPYGSS